MNLITFSIDLQLSIFIYVTTLATFGCYSCFFALLCWYYDGVNDFVATEVCWELNLRHKPAKYIFEFWIFVVLQPSTVLALPSWWHAMQYVWLQSPNSINTKATLVKFFNFKAQLTNNINGNFCNLFNFKVQIWNYYYIFWSFKTFHFLNISIL